MPTTAAFPLLLATLALSACAARRAPSPVQDTSTPAASTPGDPRRDPGQSPTSAVTASPGASETPDEPGIKVTTAHDGQRFSWQTRVDTCELTLSLEGHRMWWRATAASRVDDPCDLLGAPLRKGWARLMREASKTRSIDRIVLVIDFYQRRDAVHRWFQYQAESEAIRRAEPKRNSAAFNALLASHLTQSSALDEYRATFASMGLRILEASVEKVEVRPWSRFRRDDPSLAPAPRGNPSVALPFMTWVTLTGE